MNCENRRLNVPRLLNPTSTHTGKVPRAGVEPATVAL